MPFFKRSYLAILASFLFAACTTAQAAADHEVVDEGQSEQERGYEVDTAGWSEERLELEERFQAWLMSGMSLDEAMAQSPQRMASVAEVKADWQQELTRQFQFFIEDGDDPNVIGWATTRIAQTYLHFACELSETPTPEGLTDDQALAYEQSIRDLVNPLISETTSTLATIEGREIAVWSEKASLIIREIDPMSAESCAATAEFWLPKGRPTLEERLAELASSCNAGDASACKNAVPLSGDDEAGALLTQSCELDAHNCNAAATYFLEQDDPTRADELKRIGCDGGHDDSCRNRAAVFDSRLSERYQRECEQGSYLDCIQYARALDADSQVDLNKFCASTDADLGDLDALKSNCTDDGDGAACLGLGTHLLAEARADESSEREVEEAAILGVLMADDSNAAMIYASDEEGFIAAGTGGLGMPGSMSKDAQEQLLETRTQECDQGDLKACVAAGNLLRDGDKDPTEYFQRACEGGYSTGCFQLGDLLESQSPEEAGEYYERACLTGHSSSCWRRATQLQQTQSDDENHTRIVEIFLTTCGDDSLETCADLAFYFRERGDDLANQSCAIFYDAKRCTSQNPFACAPLLP